MKNEKDDIGNFKSDILGAKIEAYESFVYAFVGRLFDNRRRRPGQVFPDEDKRLALARSKLFVVGSREVKQAILDHTEISKGKDDKDRIKGLTALMKVFRVMRKDLGCDDMTEDELLPYFVGG